MHTPRVTPLVVLHTFVSRFLLLILMLVYAIPTLIFIMIPQRWREHKLWYWGINLCYRLLLLISFLPIKVTGEKNIPRSPVILVPNHQSSLDIPLIGSLLHSYPHTWLATHELLDSPILRFIVPSVALIIDTSSTMASMRSLINAIKNMNGYQKTAIIFPEGARFTDGKIHDFFMGFVILSRKTGRPVVPIRIYNLEKVYPPNTFWVFWHPVRVVVGSPMSIGEGETDEQFKNRVYQWFMQQGD